MAADTEGGRIPIAGLSFRHQTGDSVIRKISVTVSTVQRMILVISCVLILVSTIETFFAAKTQRWVSHASGPYVTLATDMAHGKFYPPLFGEDGYRGTRYFPLYWSTHAAFIKLGGDPYLAGFAVGILSGLILLVGLYHFLRGVGADFYLAIASVAALFGCWLTPSLMTNIRGDILPVGLTSICPNGGLQ